MRTFTFFTVLISLFASINLNAQQGGYALQFDGTKVVDCGNGASVNITGTTITLEAWIYPTAFHAEIWGSSIISKYNYLGFENYGFRLRCGGNGKADFSVSNSYANTCFATSEEEVLELNKWTHLAGTYDGANVKLYINGNLSVTVPFTLTLGETNYPLYIGNNQPGFTNRPFFGMIDEVRVWNSARTEAEIKANMYKEIGTHANLKAYYKMSDGTGTSLTDNSGNNNIGTLTNGPVWKASGCFAGSRQSLDFDGSNDFVNLPTSFSNAFDGLQHFSFCGWVYHTTLNSALWGTYFTRYNSSDWNRVTFHSLPSGSSYGYDDIMISIDNETYGHAYTTTNVLEINKWIHLAVVYDGTKSTNADKIKIYINGIHQTLDFDGTTFPTSFGTVDQYQYLGRYHNPDYFKGGKFDDFSFWNISLTESQIRENMFKTLEGNESGLFAYYRFDQYNETGGTTLYDMTVNGHNGTLTSMDATTDWVSSTAFNTWLGGESADWSNAANWSNGVPVSAQSAGIYNWNTALPNVTTLPILPATIDVNNLLVPSGVTSPSNVNITADCSVFLGSSLSLSSSALNTAGNLIIENDKTLTIPASGQLTVSGTLTNSAGNSGLVIESGGSLIHSTAGVSATAQRDITAWTDIYHGWHFLCSPVANQAISPSFVDITSNPMSTNVDLYKWSEPENNWINIKNSSNVYNQGTGSTNWSNSLNPTFETGIGYLIAYGNNQTKEFAGSLNVANVEITGLTNTSGNTKKGWHLLGNPFSSAISWTQGSWVKTNIGSAPQIWNETNASYKVLSGEGIIPPLNGFMVYTTGSGALTIPADSRQHSDSSWYKNSASVNEIVLTARDLQGNTAQETIIGFNPEATQNFDLEYDSYFLAGFAPKFYSISNNEFFALNTLPGNDPEIIIPFGFEKNNANHFRIELTESIEGKTLFLIDLKENTEHNLSLNPVYSFVSASGDDPQRFLLKMGTVGIDKDLSQTFQKAWIFNNYLYISNIDSEIIYSLFDLSGRLLQSLKLSGTGLKTIPLNEKTGFYLVKLQNRESTTILKTFVK